MKQDEVNAILEKLNRLYPNPKTLLKFRNPFELLVATMLSAQTTDKQVNRITDKLFKKYKTPEDFANLTPEQLEEDIKSCGLYKNKSKNIIAMSKILIEKYGGRVPDNLEELTTLPGIGRKTANVVLSNAFGKPALAVDTHVFRVSNRLGLADAKDVNKTEQQLCEAIPKPLWSKAHHWLIHHGRNVCSARNPKCAECPLNNRCKYHGPGGGNKKG
jgi:endonuclease-3